MTEAPDDYDEQIRALRRARELSQARLATLVGAARKAIVYQWEARKRTPSPVFWQRITALHPVSVARRGHGCGNGRSAPFDLLVERHDGVHELFAHHLIAGGRRMQAIITEQ